MMGKGVGKMKKAGVWGTARTVRARVRAFMARVAVEVEDAFVMRWP